MPFVSPVSSLSPLGLPSFNWDAYWASQPEVLFFGLYSDISGGQMPNRVPGATDYLTVAGVVGSETYQCPNTAAYIAADTDYIWFKMDESQRTVTTAELIGYDFTRTIIKYGNTAPYSIRWIMILSDDFETARENKMRDSFWLSIWWDGISSDYGRTKGNRAGEQSIWTPESIHIAYDTFTDIDGTRLNVHTMDVGTGWTEVVGTWEINGNKLIEVSDGDNYAYVETGRVNNDISIDINLPALADTLFSTAILFRFMNTSNKWQCYIENDTSQPWVALYCNGGLVSKVNVPSETSVTRKLRVVILNDNINVYYSGSGDDPIISITNTTLNTITKVGVFVFKGLGYINIPIDNFIIPI